ncbi:hypothetical protein MGN70_002915 [Eutypa lata]|nr:hypothetical protein MGN70_002915 [Eutypa lata]
MTLVRNCAIVAGQQRGRRNFRQSWTVRSEGEVDFNRRARARGYHERIAPKSTPSPSIAMITRFITEVNTKFNPFSLRSRATRLFLSSLPPDARANGMQIHSTIMPRASTEPSLLHVKFKDGKEMKLDSEKLGIKGIIEEVDRHSRALQKQADLE